MMEGIEANASKRGQRALAHYAEREHFRADTVWSIENYSPFFGDGKVVGF